MQNLELENLIENQPKKKNTVIDFVFDTPYFVRSTKYGSIIKKYSKEIVFKNTGSDNYIYFVFGFVIFIFGFRAIGDVFSRYVVLFFLLVLLLVFWYNKKRKLEEIKISEDGIIIEKTQYYWNQIYDYGFTIEPKHKSSTYYLVIFTTLGEKVSYGLYNYFDTEEIIITMNFFRNRYNSRRD
ncbi:hypothetical protein G6N05_08315 [Flavobacterium sp. F372]|uniref:YcxB family protein n=1 Tax=Flavobacterium bernardetii TaxID=2813823 RepID=A0ABR7IWW3_9FLAO|nr:hypothetical protein [Flavobacterium bernardetii]MBC5834250.1 hypothetical protein [Flavobacterium bernardetii]NHF70111.1 hypothetical protein [Flavobacterium bernardetii]